jgi:hypothetical protein
MPWTGTVLSYLINIVSGYQVVERGTGDQAGPHNQDELPTAPGDQAIAVVSVPINTEYTLFPSSTPLYPATTTYDTIWYVLLLCMRVPPTEPTASGQLAQLNLTNTPRTDWQLAQPT